MLAYCDTAVTDIWFWKKGRVYKPKLYYMHMHKNIIFNPLLMWIWGSACTKIKVFAWLLIIYRLTLEVSFSEGTGMLWMMIIVLCPTRAKEYRLYLFFQCNFSVRIWNYLQTDWHNGQDMGEVVESAKESFAQPFFCQQPAGENEQRDDMQAYMCHS